MEVLLLSILLRLSLLLFAKLLTRCNVKNNQSILPPLSSLQVNDTGTDVYDVPHIPGFRCVARI
jgi:hypothetical protein